MKIRKAVISDAPKISSLINREAEKNKLLPRTLNYIYENIRDFWVAEEKNKIIATCALHIVGWQNLAEIKSLVVAKEKRKKGIGKKLALTCLEEAKKLGAKKVFALTFIPNFFLSLDFKKIAREKLPHKIWTECINCTLFPDCQEEAVILKIK